MNLQTLFMERNISLSLTQNNFSPYLNMFIIIYHDLRAAFYSRKKQLLTQLFFFPWVGIAK